MADNPPESPLPRYLAHLNSRQREAAKAPVQGGVRVLGSPGEGSTESLVARVAHLIEYHHLKPADLIICTHTKDATDKVGFRLESRLGRKTTMKLKITTFHSLCRDYLVKHGSLVSVRSSFRVIDPQDARGIIVKLPSFGKGAISELSTGEVIRAIDIAKNNKMSPLSFRDNELGKFSEEERVQISKVWIEYQAHLDERNAYDYNDMLVKVIELFTAHGNLVKNIKSVLVTAFQNTSVLQYEVIVLLASSSNSLTIVGDPGSAIYSWKNAQVEQFDTMAQDFFPSTTIPLEENYRSSESILKLVNTLSRGAQIQPQRILRAFHSSSVPVILHEAQSSVDEGNYITSTIQSLSQQFEGIFDFDSFAILLRRKSMAVPIQRALLNAGIHSKFRGKYKFFESPIIKLILSYLRLLQNDPEDEERKKLSDNAVRQLLARREIYFTDLAKAASANKTTILEQCRRSADDPTRLSSRSLAKKRIIQDLLDVIEEGRQLPFTPYNVARMINIFVRQPDYKKFSKSEEEILVARDVAHIGDLKTFANWIAREYVGQGDLTSNHDLLEAFFGAVELSVQSEFQEVPHNGSGQRVYLSTVHAASDLEWPVVFIPAVENGIYPHGQTETESEIQEERRILYVAVTRAQSHCILSYTGKRGKNLTSLSPFISELPNYQDLFRSALPAVTPETRTAVARILNKDGEDGVEHGNSPSVNGTQSVLSTSPENEQPAATSSRPAKKRKQ
ncbi:hypothetical protein JCM5353_003356 [Sporobolomyces roseus]